MKALLRRLCALVCVGALLITPTFALSVEDALDLLERSYVNEIPSKAYEAETLDELFAIIADPYTYYMTKEEYQSFLSSVEGDDTVTGIGASILYTKDGIMLDSVLSGSGAEAAGLVSGDLIIAIEGLSCENANEEHRALLLGEVGTVVHITVKHADGSVREHAITRRTVALHNTSVTAADGIGYIDCDTFGSQTGVYFSDGIKKHDRQVRLWVVDLRGNTGGYSESAVKALSAFVGSGDLLYFKSKSGFVHRSSCHDTDLTDKPVIVLTNGRTASASEIFSGGISGRNAGIVVGSRTFGKGVAQIVYDADNSSLFDGDALKVTTYRFYLADGNTSDRIGIIPTVCVDSAIAPEVASLLCAEKPAGSSAYLHLILNGLDFYVNLPDAQASHAPALNALLSALAPDAVVFYGENGSERAATVKELCSLCASPVPDRSFIDTSQSAYSDKINALGVYQLVFGDGNGMFRPSDTMTRAEVCCLLAQALGITSDADGYFTDVPSGSWYAGSVNAMAALDLVNGIGNGRFVPSGTMTQEEFLTIMGRLAEFLNLNAGNYLDNHPLAMLEPLECYQEFSSWAIRGTDLLANFCPHETDVKAGMLFTPLEQLEPKAPVLRGQAAATMYNLLTGLGILSY